MTVNKSIFAAAALLAVCGWANTASAFGPYIHDYWGWSGLGYRCSTVRDFSVPYYAVYPPVYYAESVARPYGYSPFAYPPGVFTPSGIASSAEPLMVRNGYVTGGAAPESGSSGPKRITNPFVTAASSPRPAPGPLSAPVAEPPGGLEIIQPPSFR